MRCVLLLRANYLRLGVDQFIEDENTIDGGDAFNGTPSSKYAEGEREQKRDVVGATIAFWFILVGTLIWGYGDLVGNFFRLALPKSRLFWQGNDSEYRKHSYNDMRERIQRKLQYTRHTSVLLLFLS